MGAPGQPSQSDVEPGMSNGRLSSRPTHVATLGAAFSANKGAASMLEALIDRLPERLGPCRFSVLTTYPHEDIRQPIDPAVRLVSLTPPRLALVAFPLALLSRLARSVGLPTPWVRWVPPLKAIEDADLVVDLAGISFADGRRLALLVYNVLMTGTPLLLGRPVVKAPQALGPFRTRTVRRAARALLPRLEAVCARGDRTAAQLHGLGDVEVVRADDLAFLLSVPGGTFERVQARWPRREGVERIALVPSAVVERYAASGGLDLSALLADFTDRISGPGREIILVPHAIRPGAPASHMNDLPLCRRIHARVTRQDQCLLVEDDLTPGELRALLGGADLIVTARFHAMISALATATAPLVITWSHKYLEVLESFDLHECAIGYEALDLDLLERRFHEVRERAVVIHDRIVARLPGARDRALKGLDAIAEASDTSRVKR